ncbi:MAG: phosphoribosyltransferase family protein [Nautiliaceae bacterium]
MEKYYYKYDEFMNDLEVLEPQIKEFNPDTLLAIARGGMTIGHFLAERLDTREIYSLNAISYENEKKIGKPKIFNIPDLKNKKRVLLLDDISDSGETLEEVLKTLKNLYPKIEFKTLTIFYKDHTKVMPDIYIKKTDKWVVFFWDKEGQTKEKS